MKEICADFKHQDKTFKIYMNFNVMQEIQEEYGEFPNWFRLVFAKEINAKALIFGLKAALNEGIDIENDGKSDADKLPFLTHKQVGRMISNRDSINYISEQLLDLVKRSTEAGEDSKNESSKTKTAQS